MEPSILIFATVLIALCFAGYRVYHRYVIHEFGREFTGKYFGPHPAHPVFGTIKGFDNGWEFYAPLPTAGLDTSQVRFTIEADPNSTHVENYELLRAKWVAVWPMIFDALNKVITDYGFAEAFSSSIPNLTVHLPDESLGDDTEWSVSLMFEPSAGIYDVHMHGWTEIVDSGATF